MSEHLRSKLQRLFQPSQRQPRRAKSQLSRQEPRGRWENTITRVLFLLNALACLSGHCDRSPARKWSAVRQAPLTPKHLPRPTAGNRGEQRSGRFSRRRENNGDGPWEAATRRNEDSRVSEGQTKRAGNRHAMFGVYSSVTSREKKAAGVETPRLALAMDLGRVGPSLISNQQDSCGGRFFSMDCCAVQKHSQRDNKGGS